MNQKLFINILMLTGIILFVGIIGGFIINRPAPPPLPVPLPDPTPVPTPTPPPAPIACTSDSDCPSSRYSCQAIEGTGTVYPANGDDSSTFTITKGECKLKEGNHCSLDSDCLAGLLCHDNACTNPIGQECGEPNDASCPSGFECVQGCGPPVPRDDDPPPPYFCQLEGYERPCPICLAENTLIDTPSGKIPAQQLQKGMTIWTVNSAGVRIPAAVLETVKTPVPQTHQMVHLILNDGRELLVSPGHPVGDGRVIGDITTGDTLDGSRVVTAERVPYQNGFTYDILPSGETGLYFANDILIGSTLSSGE